MLVSILDRDKCSKVELNPDLELNAYTLTMMLIPLKKVALEEMEREYPVEYSRYMGMVEHGSNSKLATESHAASVLYNKLLADNEGNKEVQHDPVMLSHLEPT